MLSEHQRMSSTFDNFNEKELLSLQIHLEKCCSFECSAVKEMYEIFHWPAVLHHTMLWIKLIDVYCISRKSINSSSNRC